MLKDSGVSARVLPVAALEVWVINLPSLPRELSQVRIAGPDRVRHEDAELVAAAAGPPRPSSPWGLVPDSAAERPLVAARFRRGAGRRPRLPIQEQGSRIACSPADKKILPALQWRGSLSAGNLGSL